MEHEKLSLEKKAIEIKPGASNEEIITILNEADKNGPDELSMEAKSAEAFSGTEKLQELKLENENLIFEKQLLEEAEKMEGQDRETIMMAKDELLQVDSSFNKLRHSARKVAMLTCLFVASSVAGNLIMPKESEAGSSRGSDKTKQTVIKEVSDVVQDWLKNRRDANKEEEKTRRNQEKEDARSERERIKKEKKLGEQTIKETNKTERQKDKTQGSVMEEAIKHKGDKSIKYDRGGDQGETSIDIDSGAGSAERSSSGDGNLKKLEDENEKLKEQIRLLQEKAELEAKRQQLASQYK